MDPTSGHRVYVPPGWPERVRPPGSSDWLATATEFLLDCCPADYRGYPLLRRHPVVLARFATEFVAGQLASSRSGLSRVRVDLSEHVSPPVVESAVSAWQQETARLVGVSRAVTLVEEAVRGGRFVPRW